MLNVSSIAIKKRGREYYANKNKEDTVESVLDKGFYVSFKASSRVAVYVV